MTCEQVAFFDEENNKSYGIIVYTGLNDWFIICGCCGTIFYPEDVHGVETMKNWVSFQNAIRD